MQLQDLFSLSDEETALPCRAPLAESNGSACAPRYRCGYPGCNKRYASTDGVRKHARKTHTQWLKEVDEQSALRDHRLYGNKPSTYCTMEQPEGGVTPAAAGAALPQATLQEQQQLLQQFLARLQPGSNPAVASILLGASTESAPAESAPANVALAPSSLLLGAGCKRDASNLCGSGAPKRMRVVSLLDGTSDDERDLVDSADDSASSSLSSSPRHSADALLTPLTVPLPRPLSGSGEVSPFRLDTGAEAPLDQQSFCLEPQPLCRSDSSFSKQMPNCDDLFSFPMDDDECAAFLRTILA